MDMISRKAQHIRGRRGFAASVALIALDGRLTEYDIHYRVGQRVANTQDAMIVGIAHPQELSSGIRRQAEHTVLYLNLSQNFPRH